MHIAFCQATLLDHAIVVDDEVQFIADKPTAVNSTVAFGRRGIKALLESLEAFFSGQFDHRYGDGVHHHHLALGLQALRHLCLHLFKGRLQSAAPAVKTGAANKMGKQRLVIGLQFAPQQVLRVYAQGFHGAA